MTGGDAAGTGAKRAGKGSPETGTVVTVGTGISIITEQEEMQVVVLRHISQPISASGESRGGNRLGSPVVVAGGGKVGGSDNESPGHTAGVSINSQPEILGSFSGHVKAETLECSRLA